MENNDFLPLNQGLSLNHIIHKLLTPFQAHNNKNSKRKGAILNILLLVSAILSVILFFSNLHKSAEENYLSKNRIFSLQSLFLITVFFIIFYFISRAGFIKLSSYLFLGTYFIALTFSIYKWGVSIPHCLLLYALLITMSGFLIGAQFAFLLTLAISFIILMLGYLQMNGLYSILLGGKQHFNMSDIFFCILTLETINLITWLYNLEIERSLRRALQSEKALKKEKDTLEERVEERALELKKMQIDKMEHLCRCAEFGRLSSGLFHDLLNPLTAISLNLEQIKEDDKDEIYNAKYYMEQAISATNKMREFLMAIKNQMGNEHAEVCFYLNEEIKELIQIFTFKSRRSGVELAFEEKEKLKFCGDPIKFSQLVSNLISNAIDSYEAPATETKREKNVLIQLYKKEGHIHLVVQDWGSGIPENVKGRIFEPFFTTKLPDKGLGIGLATVKNIVEQDLKGKIDVKTRVGEGTIFSIHFPAQKNKSAC